jgi:hypothetical protein
MRLTTSTTAAKAWDRDRQLPADLLLLLLLLQMTVQLLSLRHTGSGCRFPHAGKIVFG